MPIVVITLMKKTGKEEIILFLFVTEINAFARWAQPEAQLSEYFVEIWVSDSTVVIDQEKYPQDIWHKLIWPQEFGVFTPGGSYGLQIRAQCEFAELETKLQTGTCVAVLQ